MNFDFLSETELFGGCQPEDIRQMAASLNLHTARYPKGSVIFEAGTAITNIGLVLSGSVQISHHDYWGNKSILAIAKEGEIFAESYACIPGERLMIEASANELSEIVFISVPDLLQPFQNTGNSLHLQNRIIQNLVVISARKNLHLARRSLHTAPKTIRERLLSYFSQLISEQGSSRITVPFNRQQMADYLNLDRSALSKELGRMKKEGLLDYRKNTFVIKTQP